MKQEIKNTSKTPKFDRAIADYFVKLELDERGGERRTCRFSGKKFYVRPEDVSFYKRIGVPLPTLEPEERRRRRHAYHNSYNLFRNTSAYSGNRVITMYPAGSPYKVYEHNVWYSDAWDPRESARDYDSAKSFFEQFHVFQRDVPRTNLLSSPSNLNSDYTNTSRNLKDCYIVFDQNGGENLIYHQCCGNDTNCVECWSLDNCDQCYECRISRRLFQCYFCYECRDCLDGYFLWDSRNCQNCFMSSNLRNKKYYFRNEYVGKAEYEQRMKAVYLGDYHKLQELKSEFEEVIQRAPRKPNWNERSVNSVGDYIVNSKNVYFGLWIDKSENVAYSEAARALTDCYDVTGSGGTQLSYEVSTIWGVDNYECKFSLHIESCREVEYCDSCRNCWHCFGSIGLDNQEYCVFNKKYSKDEYWELVDTIKTSMLTQGEYGEFFPPAHALFPYRVSLAVSFPGFRDFENAEKYGYDTGDVEEENEHIAGDIINARDLPNDIQDVDDDILKQVVFDEKNRKYFRIIKPELDFYRMRGVPLPREHASVRMQKFRETLDVKFEFYKRQCPSCKTEFETSYKPDFQGTVYCESCYQKQLVL